MSNDILLLLMYMAFFYPVSVAALRQLRKPVGVIVQEATLLQPIIRCLGAENAVITPSTSKPAIIRLLKSASIVPIVCVGRNTDAVPRTIEEKWQMIIDAARISEVEGETVKSQIIFIFVKRIPQAFEKEFFKIFLDETDFTGGCYGIDLQRYQGACLDARTLETVCGAYRDVTDSERAFWFVIHLAALYEQVDAERLIATAKQLVQYDDEVEDIGGVADMFRFLLYKYVETRKFSDIYQLPNLESDVITRIGECMFYDNQYLFIPDGLFRQITIEMRDIYPVDVIKKSLSDEEVLKAGAGRYASKMGFVTPFGQSKRITMLRFQREKVNRLSEMDFVDFCESFKEDSHE